MAMFLKAHSDGQQDEEVLWIIYQTIIQYKYYPGMTWV